MAASLSSRPRRSMSGGMPSPNFLASDTVQGIMGMKQPRPVTNPYVFGQAPIQRQAAGVQGYADSLSQARQSGTPGGGLMSNEAAQILYGQTGYMPSVTVGGNWGARPSMGRHPQAHLSTKQQKDIMRADANAAAYEAQMAARQAALSTGMTRPEVEAFAGAIDPATGRSRGLDVFDAGDKDMFGRPIPGGSTGLRASSGLRSQMMDRGTLPTAPTQQQLASNRAAYDARRDADMAARREAVTGRASARRDYRDFMQTPFGQFMGNNPGAAFNYQQQAQQLGIERQRVQDQSNVATAKQTGEDRKAKMDFAANLIGALPAMVEGGMMDQETATQVAQQALADAIGLGPGGGGAGGMPGTPADPGQTAGPPAPLTPPQRAKQFDPLKADPQAVVAELRKRGYSGARLNQELNKIYGNTGALSRSRTAADPTGFWNYWGGQLVDDQGNPYNTPHGMIGEGIAAIGNMPIGPGINLFDAMNSGRPVARPAIRGQVIRGDGKVIGNVDTQNMENPPLPSTKGKNRQYMISPFLF